MFVIPFLVYSILAIYEFIPLYKQKLWRDFWVNASLGLCSFTIALLMSFGIKIPSPVMPIQKLIVSLLGK